MALHTLSRLRRLAGLAVACLATAFTGHAHADTTRIVAQHSGKCLDVTGGEAATGDGALLEQWSCVSGARNEAFTLKDMGGGQFELIASHSGKCIGTAGGGSINGTLIEQRTCSGAPAQLWQAAPAGTPGQYHLVSAPGQRCLDVIGGNGATADGIRVELWDCVGSANQTWSLAVPAIAPPSPIVARHSGKCLDVIGGNAGIGNGVRLEQWTCATDAFNQAFTLRAAGNDTYQLVARHSGRCVEVVGSSKNNGAPIDQWDCSSTAPQQLWRLRDVGDGYQQIVSALSGKCLDVTGGNAAVSDGALVEQWDCVAGANNQAWNVRQAAAPAHCPVSTAAPAIATQAAWDAKYDATYGSSLPNTGTNRSDYAWHGHYWVRAYVSMARTYGDTKYLDTARRMIDVWMNQINDPQGWRSNTNTADPSQMSLETAVISSAVLLFAYEVWNDSRFAAYQSVAEAYLSRLEPILRSYDRQWVDNAPFPGSPSFYVYASCGGLCSPNSLMYYNQGAALAKALLLIDHIQRVRKLVPNPAYADKAGKAAAYFKTFRRSNGNASVWNYEGARTDRTPTVEDVSHGHLDLSLLLWARQAGLGGLDDTDMKSLAATMATVMDGTPSHNDVAHFVNGTGASDDDARVSLGYDWIDLADDDGTLLDRTIGVYNRYLADPNRVNTSRARAYLGWAEILRKRSCVSLY